MKFQNPFRTLTKGEWVLLLGSWAAVLAAFCICRQFPVIEILGCLLGVTGLLFISKGEVFGQVIAIGFALCYAYVAFTFRYYGEMICFLLMNTPISIATVVTWLRHPYQDSSKVQVNHLRKLHWILLIVLTAAVTTGFFFLLRWLGTSNLLFSTISMATSFSACYLMLFRSHFYAIAYCCNDIVLIILWTLATCQDLSYLPTLICMCIFLIHDGYGFINWQKMHRRQNLDKKMGKEKEFENF